MEQKVIKFLNSISAIFLVLVLVAFLIGGPLWLLWNWLMPSIFGLPYITFWQAVGLNLLSAILFGKVNLKKD